jgi:septum site-determining protein MinD
VDSVLVLTNPEISAVRDADRVIGLLEADGKGPALLVINRLNPVMVRRGDMLSVDDVIDLLAIDLIGIIPEDESVIVASNKGQPLALDGKNKTGQAFQNIASRLMGENVAFLDFEQQNVFQRLLGRK